MELKHDCVRNLLITIEEEVGFNKSLPAEELADFSSLEEFSLDDVRYTLKKLNEAGFISIDVYHDDTYVNELTFNGHQFLDNIRGSNIWAETKSHLSKIGGAASLSIISELASSLIKTKLGLS
ncbi:DUF2513 domain-containing protein [Bacillus sonorensis]|uniref:DUF2513 domain-containing protein n=1 Tax=Bacillus sonorensis TaxID=119858 RepID=UPI00098B751E|nr:DUF2513 domain-containing protein [Bacillus sonorensis]